MMSFYIRKSVSVGAFRFNLSSAGVGMSVGIRGFRIGTGPRGNYIHMGLGGVYYRATLPKRKPVARSDVNPVIQNDQTPTSDGLTEIESGPLAQMAPASAQELLARIADAHARTRLAPVVAVLAPTLALVFLLANLHVAAVYAAIAGFLAYVLARRVDDGRKVVLLYDLEPDAEQAFRRFCAAFDALLAAQSIWRIEAQGVTDDWKRNAGASSLIRRKKLHPAYATPSSIAANLSVPCLLVGHKQVFFFPDRLLVFEGKVAGAIEFAELSMDAKPARFIEEESVPSDAQIVDYTWRFVNKSGGPDRRFNNNRQLPICRYDQLDLGSFSGLKERLSVSRPGAAIAFAAGVYRYREDLRSLARATQPMAHPSGGIVGPVVRNLDQLPGSSRRHLAWAGLALVVLLPVISMLWRAPETKPIPMDSGHSSPATKQDAPPRQTTGATGNSSTASPAEAP